MQHLAGASTVHQKPCAVFCFTTVRTVTAQGVHWDTGVNPVFYFFDQGGLPLLKLPITSPR
jgi:hypothetical protein